MGQGEKQRFGQFLEGAGFSLVELMAVMVITVIGFLAMIHLQAGVIRGNTTTWDMVTATNLAQHVLESIRLESVEWTNDSVQGPTQGQFKYLQHVNDTVPPAVGTGSGWLRAFDVPNAPFQMVNQLGRDAAYNPGSLVQFPDTRNRRFCVQYRLTWLILNYLIRAEVRVAWPREDGRGGLYDACPLGMETDMVNVYSVTYPTTIMKNVFVVP